MPKHNKLLGAFGEAYAARWLATRGYIIITRNWRRATGEIDIIAQKDDTIVFVEVKTLRCTSYADLAIIVGKRKQKRICETAKHFLASAREYNHMCARFDVIVLRSDPFRRQDVDIVHLPHAFEDLV